MQVHTHHYHQTLQLRNELVNSRWEQQKQVHGLTGDLASLTKRAQSCRRAHQGYAQRLATWTAVAAELGVKNSLVSTLKQEFEKQMEDMLLDGDFPGREFLGGLFTQLRSYSRTVHQLSAAHNSVHQKLVKGASEAASGKAARATRTQKHLDADLLALLGDGQEDLGGTAAGSSASKAVELPDLFSNADQQPAFLRPLTKQQELLLQEKTSVLVSADGSSPLRMLAKHAFAVVSQEVMSEKDPAAAIQLMAAALERRLAPPASLAAGSAGGVVGTEPVSATAGATAAAAAGAVGATGSASAAAAGHAVPAAAIPAVAAPGTAGVGGAAPSAAAVPQPAATPPPPAQPSAAAAAAATSSKASAVWPADLPSNPAELAVLLAESVLCAYEVRCGFGLLSDEMLEHRDPVTYRFVAECGQATAKV